MIYYIYTCDMHMWNTSACFFHFIHVIHILSGLLVDCGSADAAPMAVGILGTGLVFR